jgi:hypothetical protein
MKKRVTAAELLEHLKADPEYIAARERETEARDKVEAELREAEQPLIGALSEVGVDVGSVWDLVNRASPYSEALPVLVSHLLQPYPDAIREGIARALAVPAARFVWNSLLDAYLCENSQRVKDGLATAIAATADDQNMNEVMELLRDTRHGASRLLLLPAIARSKSPHARDLLEDLSEDPVLKKEVRATLRRSG